jgi:putative ABC transport system substrate-binding protein
VGGKLGETMRRRNFIGLVAGAIAAPGALLAQSSSRRIGIIVGYSETDSEVQSRLTSFKRKLEDLGWHDGRNVRIELRFSGTEPARIQSDAADLAQSSQIILASPGQVALAVQRETKNVPIVFANVPDPVSIGLVESLAHPGGNVTGFTSQEATLAGKWLEILKEIAPNVKRVGVIYSPANPAWQSRLRIIEGLAPSLGIEITPIGTQYPQELEAAVKSWADGSVSALILLPSVATMNYRSSVVDLAARFRLPAVYPWAFVAANGGLVSYGIDITEQFRDAATYVDRIFKGERPENLPVQAADKFDLVINLKSARELVLMVSPALLARATNVIE